MKNECTYIPNADYSPCFCCACAIEVGMTSYTINSDTSLQNFIGAIRETYNEFKFLRVNIKTDKDRSLSQNAITHAWYEQIARELREESALGWKCYCKLHHGVPILRAEDEEFRDAYDQVIKGLRYEQKLISMRFMPVTSIMNKDQLSKYAAAMQEDFRSRCVLLEFPDASNCSKNGSLN